MAWQVLVLHFHPSTTPTLMPVSGSGFLPLADASPGLQSPRNRLKSATQRDWLSTFFKSQLLQLGSMQLAFCAYCITAEGECSLFVNRQQILATFIPTVIWIQAAGICKLPPTYCALNNTCHGLPGYKVMSGSPQTATFRFPHTFPGIKQIYDLIVLGRNILHSWKRGVIKSIICAVVEVMMKSFI